MSKSLGNARRAAGRHPPERRRDPAPVGRRWSTTPRTSGSARPSCRPRSTPTASSATPSATCWARWPASTTAERRRAGRHAAAGALHPAPAVGARSARCARPTRPTSSRTVVRPLADFCSNDLSALFFDIRRDVLYCDRPRAPAPPRLPHGDGPGVRAADRLAGADPRLHLEEAWATRFPDAGPNALRVFPETPADWRERRRGRALGARSSAVTRVVTGALEVERRDKRIGAALEAAPGSGSPIPTLMAAFDGLDAAEVFRTSDADAGRRRGPGGRLPPRRGRRRRGRAARAEGRKCARCWRVLPEVTPPAMLCERCEEAVAIWDTRAAA